MSKKVLCLLNDGVEETEIVAPVDVLRRAGIEVVIAATHEMLVTSKGGMKIGADVLLSDVSSSDFDLLMIPGGPAVEALLADGRASALCKEFAAADKPVAAICAAPLILKDAGLLDGRRFTAYQSVRPDLGGGLDERVVIDGKIITSCGPGTALDFGLALVAYLDCQETADRVAEEMMVRVYE